MNQDVANIWFNEIQAGDDMEQFLETHFLGSCFTPSDFGSIIEKLLKAEKLNLYQWLQIVEKGLEINYNSVITVFKKEYSKYTDKFKHLFAIKILNENGMNISLNETYSDLEKSMFFDELPLVDSNEILDEVKKIYSKYDPYFIASGCTTERREKFDKLWIKYKPYADRHFLTQIKTNFHQRSWEMYVGNILLKNGFDLKSKDEGPDFIVNGNLYIECVAPTKGDPTKPDSVPEMFVAMTSEEICVQDVPFDKMILRITQAIKDKALDQYEKWKVKKWFSAKAPFVIVVNTGDLQYGNNPSLPNVLKALFGFQFMQINMRNGAINFSYRDIIKKSNNEPVPVNYFINKDFSFISGVLFSNKTVLNHPENIGDDCVFVNNPFDDNRVSKLFIKPFKSWTASKEGNGISLRKNY